jgi:tetratricopeptide (TPR) repeat protein
LRERQSSDDAELRLALADVHELVGHYPEAFELYDRVRAATNDVRAWAGKAAALRRQGDYAGALRVVDEAMATTALAGKDLSALWLESGWTLSLSGRPGEAIDVFQAGIEAARPRRDPAVAGLIVQLARAEAALGRFEDALEHGLEAQAICEEHGDLRGLATARRVVGSAYWFLDRFDEAAAALRQGLELAERIGSAEEIGACLLNLALVEKRRDALPEAMACERRAIEQFDRIGHDSGRAQAYTNLADSLERAGELEEALEYCERAQALASAIGYPRAIADTANTVANVELKRENFAAAGARAEEAAELYLELGAVNEAAEMLALATQAWEEAGQEERARACSTRARDLTPA